MYTEIGAFDAKAKLSELLRAVKKGQRYTITLRGQPIADLVPCANHYGQNVYDAISDMRSIAKIQGIAPGTLTEWIEEGRQ